MKQDTTTLATFLYDADGNRVKGTVSGVTTVYVSQYLEVTGSFTNPSYRRYAFVNGVRLWMSDLVDTDGVWVLGDHLGSTSVTADATNGARVTELRYYPYGSTRYDAGRFSP